MPKRQLDPLSTTAFHILLSLADEDLHGYGMMRRVSEQSEGRLRLSPGTLYSSLQALLEESLIEELDAQSIESDIAERRRTYRLTTKGRALARIEADRLASTLHIAIAKGLLRGGHV